MSRITREEEKKSSPPVPLFFLFMQASTNSLLLLRPSFSSASQKTQANESPFITLCFGLFLSPELPLAHLLKNPKKKKKKSSPPVPLFFLFMQASTNSLPLLRPSFSLSRFSHPLSNYSTASTTAIAWSHPRLCISCMKLHRSWSPTL